MSKTPDKTPKDDREARLAGALRANLARRKASVRKQAAAKPAPPKDANG